MRDPLIIPCAAIAAGILAARVTVIAHGDILLCVAGGFLLALLSLWRDLRFAGYAACALAFCGAGAWLASTHTPGPPPRLDAAEGEVVVLSGCVVESPAMLGDRERFILELEPGARAQVTLYTREGETLPVLAYGQPVEIEAKVRTPHNFGNPGAFDYARYLARQDIYWTASAAATTVKALNGACGSRMMAAVMALRTAALRRIEQLYPGDGYSAGMMQAILIGQSAQLQRVWTENYRATGTFHALVISGTHVAVLAAFLLFLLRICFISEEAALFLTVLAAWLYALVTGWQAPCVRSAAGMALFTIGRYCFRQRRILNLLAAVAIGYLVCDPDQLFEPSFQLTFLAVAFIGAFATPLLEATSAPLVRGLDGLEDTDRDLHLAPRVAQFRIELRLLVETLRLWARMPQQFARWLVTGVARVGFFVYEVVAVSAMVQLGLALPMVVYFHRLGISGLSANAIIVPLMGLVVPAGFVAIFTGWTWVACLTGGLLSISRAVVDWHARLEPGWRIPTPPLWLSIAIALLLIATAASRRWWRAAAASLLAVSMGLLLAHPFAVDVRSGTLELTAVDVGQGDSLLVAFPDRRLMIVDGGGIPSFGGRPARSQLDIGEDVVAPYLWSRSVRQVDVLVMSHAHDDHIGGLPALLAAFHPRELWTGAAPDTPKWHALRELALSHGIRVRPMTGPQRFAYGGTRIDVLSPPPDYVPAEVAKNDDSVVLRVSYGRHSFLLTGDVERQSEFRMVDGGEVGRSDVLKVAHHGSRTSTTDDFLNAVHPAFALISAGAGNLYGHPHPAVIARLEQNHVMTLRTDRDGLISVRSDGRHLEVQTNRWSHTHTAGLLNVF